MNLENVFFRHSLVKETVEAIISKSQIPPIIILQGDHGIQQAFRGEFRTYTDTKDEVEKKYFLQENFRILNAYYLPDGSKDKLYESISPVSSFRIVFNHYFNDNCKLLPDKSYYNPFDKCGYPIYSNVELLFMVVHICK